MNTSRLELFDRERQLILVAKLIDTQNDWIYAEITNDLRKPETIKLFNEFSDLVENQLFSLADEMEDKIDKLEISVGPNFLKIKDIQIFDANLTFKMK